MVTDTTEGSAPRFRPGGRRASLGQRLAALQEGEPTLRGPAGTAKRKPLWFGASSPAARRCRRNAWPPGHLRDGLALAVDADLQLMDLGRDTGRLDLELVFAIQREIAVDLQPAAGAEGQVLVAAVLGLPHRRDVGVHQHAHVRIAHRRAADLARRRQVALHRCRRDEQRVSQVVEAAARVIGRQQRGVIELLGKIRQREQIADHVGVFGAGQAVGERQGAGIWAARRRWLRARAPGGRPRACRTRAAARCARRRHRSRAQLAQDLLPGLRLVAGARDARRIECEACGSQPPVVAGRAVLRDARLRFGGDIRRRGTARATGGFCEKPWECPWNKPKPSPANAIPAIRRPRMRA